MKKITLLSFIIALFTFCNQVNAQVTNNLILHYSFDNANALDEVGSNNGTINGATTCPDRFGNPNMAFNFSSANIRADAISFGTITEASISVWLEPDISTFNGPIASPIQLELSSSLFMNRFNSDGRILSIMDSSSGNNTPADQSNPISQNDWTHIVATNDGTTTKLYINGTLENSYSEIINWVNGVFLLLGHAEFNGTPVHYYNGKMDDFRIYNRALDDLEVDSLFNIQNPNTSLSENETSNEIVIYPNPTTNSFNINSNQLIVNSVEIIDMLGTTILKQSVSQQSVIDLTSYPDGVYFVRILNSNKVVGIKRIIKTAQ